MNDIPEYFAIAAKIIERAERGLPQDRWMRGDHEMEALVRAYIALLRTCSTYARRHDTARHRRNGY